MMCTRLRPGHSSVPVGDSSRCSEEILKISNFAFQFDYYYHHHHHHHHHHYHFYHYHYYYIAGDSYRQRCSYELISFNAGEIELQITLCSRNRLLTLARHHRMVWSGHVYGSGYQTCSAVLVANACLFFNSIGCLSSHHHASVSSGTDHAQTSVSCCYH